MGGKSMATSATRLEALSIQSSTYGATIPWLRGTQRVPGNLLWYGNFKATAYTQKTGGKGGGGGGNTTYSYSASLMMSLCHGTIAAIPKVWKGKGSTSLAALGLTQLSGALGQAPWAGLGGGPQAIGYSGLACVAGLNYALGDSASVENHSFEVKHASAGATVAGSLDVDPAVALRELLTDPTEGAGLSAGVLADWTPWSQWCVASGLLVSPLLSEQQPAIEVLRAAASLTGAGLVWSGGKLKVIPYADQAASGNGQSYTPNATPVYQLDDTCYTPGLGQEPLRVALKTASDLHNHQRVEYKDRANEYQVAIAEAKDLTDINANGLKSAQPLTAHWVTSASVARQVAEMAKQRSLLVAAEYEFELPWHYALLEPMDLITLSDAALGMQDVPARVTQITEGADGTLTVRAEDFPAGTANAPLYAAQAPEGFAGNVFVSPGSVSKTVIFEGPGALTGGQLQVWVAARGNDANWGGCTVWVSLDGTTYKALGRLQGGSRCGQLASAISGGVLPVQIGAAQQLNTVSATDAAALASLCYVGGAAPEYLSYTSAALAGAGAYNLSNLYRAAYGTTGTPHAGGDPFVFVDQSVAKSDALDAELIGKTVYIKCTSFNIFGLAEQSLDSVSAQSYVLTGALRGAGNDVITLGLSTDTLALPADSTGAVTSYALASTVARVYVNAADDSAAWDFAGTATTGLSFSRSGNVFTLTALLAGIPTARLDITATKAGAPSLTKSLYVSKAMGGTAGAAGTPGAAGGTGANGIRTADASVYAWALAGAPAISGGSTYTWATGALDAAPSGWALAPGSGTPGFALYRATVRLSNAGTSPTDAVNWTLAGVAPAGYAGADGAPGSNGANGAPGAAGRSARVAYAAVSSGTSLGAGLKTSTGEASLPANNAWDGGEVWQANSPSITAGQTVWQANGIFDPISGDVTWDSPFVSALKVGSLSAISANLGSITAGSLDIGSGRFQVSSSGYLVARGVQIQDESGNIVLSTKSGASAQLPASWVNPATGWINGNISITATGQLVGAGGGQITTLAAADTRNANDPPSAYQVGTTVEFKTRSVVGAPGVANFGSLTTDKGWNDPTGSAVVQTFKSDDGIFKRVNQPGSYSSWGAWTPILDRQIDSANISTYIAGAAIGLAYINKATIGSLSALSAYMGNVQIDSGGAVWSGKTSAGSSATGFYLGNDGGSPKFNIGTADAYLTFAPDTGLQLIGARFGVLMANAISALSGSGAGYGSWTYLGTRTASINAADSIGESGSYSYQWAIVTQSPSDSLRINGSTTGAACEIQGKGTGIVATATVSCVIRDLGSNLSTTASFGVTWSMGASSGVYATYNGKGVSVVRYNVGTLTAKMLVNRDGTVGGSGTPSPAADSLSGSSWYVGGGGTVGDGYQVRVSHAAGSDGLSVSGITLGSWTTISSTITVSVTGNSRSAQLLVEISNNASTVLASGVVSLETYRETLE